MRLNNWKTKLTLTLGFFAVTLAGFVVYASTPTILGSGTTPYSSVIDGPATLTARRLIIPVDDPPSTWHYHPGTLLAAVGDVQAPIENTGSVTIEDGCGGSETFGPGQAFEQADGRVHRAVNYTGATVEEHNMFINPPGTPLTVNIPNNERLCGPVRNADECANWQIFTFPRAFRSRGECLHFVLNRKPGEELAQ